MSNISQQEKSLRLANFADLEAYDGDSVYTSTCWVNPYDGVLCDNLYNSMSFAWYVHVKAVREYDAYRRWWIEHALDSEENPHHDWLDKVYAVVSGEKRPIVIVDGEIKPYSSVMAIVSEVPEPPTVVRTLRRSGRELICVQTKKRIEA